MKYLIIFSLLFFSFCTKHSVPKEYRDMMRKNELRKRREYRDSILLSMDTTGFKWYLVSDSTLLGVPKIIK